MATDLIAQGLALKASRASLPKAIRDALRPYATGTTLLQGLPPVMATPPTIIYGQARGATTIGIVNGGTGYAVGNTLTVVGGTGMQVATTIYVNAVSGGVITAASIAKAGIYTGGAGGVPSNAVAVTGGAGSGATFNLTYANGSANDKTFGGTSYSGGNAALRKTALAFGSVSGGSGNTVSQYSDFIIEFWTDALTPLLTFVTSTHSFMVTVDGERIRDTGFNGSASGDYFVLSLDFTASVRKARRIVIKGINLIFYTVNVNTSESVWLPPEARRDLGVFWGDSYVNLTGAGPGNAFYDVIARVLGIDVMGSGVGGTGWKTVSPDNVGRMNNILNNINVAPWAFFIPFGYNDAGTTGGATIQAQCYAVLEAITLKFPSAKIFLISPWTPLGNTTNLTYVATYMKAAFDAFVAAYPSAWARWIDISTVVTSSNAPLYTGGDNVHPNGSAGSEFLGNRIAQLCAAQLWP